MVYFYTGGLPWQNLSSCHSRNQKYKKIGDCKQEFKDKLCDKCPDQFKKFADYCRNLRFESKPDYDYLLSLITDLANQRQINLHDGIYDWAVRAICIKKHSNFYDFIERKNDPNPLNEHGTFQIHIVPRDKQSEEQRIYQEASMFKFEDPKQLVKLIRKEEIKRLKSKPRVDQKMDDKCKDFFQLFNQCKNIKISHQQNGSKELCGYQIIERQIFKEKMLKDMQEKKNGDPKNNKISRIKNQKNQANRRGNKQVNKRNADPDDDQIRDRSGDDQVDQNGLIIGPNLRNGRIGQNNQRNAEAGVLRQNQIDGAINDISQQAANHNIQQNAPQRDQDSANLSDNCIDEMLPNDKSMPCELNANRDGNIKIAMSAKNPKLPQGDKWQFMAYEPSVNQLLFNPNYNNFLPQQQANQQIPAQNRQQLQIDNQQNQGQAQNSIPQNFQNINQQNRANLQNIGQINQPVAIQALNQQQNVLIQGINQQAHGPNNGQKFEKMKQQHINQIINKFFPNQFPQFQSNQVHQIQIIGQNAQLQNPQLVAHAAPQQQNVQPALQSDNNRPAGQNENVAVIQASQGQQQADRSQIQQQQIQQLQGNSLISQNQQQVIRLQPPLGENVQNKERIPQVQVLANIANVPINQAQKKDQIVHGQQLKQLANVQQNQPKPIGNSQRQQIDGQVINIGDQYQQNGISFVDQNQVQQQIAKSNESRKNVGDFQNNHQVLPAQQNLNQALQSLGPQQQIHANGIQAQQQQFDSENQIIQQKNIKAQKQIRENEGNFRQSNQDRLNNQKVLKNSSQSRKSISQPNEQIHMIPFDNNQVENQVADANQIHKYSNDMNQDEQQNVQEGPIQSQQLGQIAALEQPRVFPGGQADIIQPNASQIPQNENQQQNNQYLQIPQQEQEQSRRNQINKDNGGLLKQSMNRCASQDFSNNQYVYKDELPENQQHPIRLSIQDQLKLHGSSQKKSIGENEDEEESDVLEMISYMIEQENDKSLQMISRFSQINNLSEIEPMKNGLIEKFQQLNDQMLKKKMQVKIKNSDGKIISNIRNKTVQRDSNKNFAQKKYKVSCNQLNVDQSINNPILRSNNMQISKERYKNAFALDFLPSNNPVLPIGSPLNINNQKSPPNMLAQQKQSSQLGKYHLLGSQSKHIGGPSSKDVSSKQNNQSQNVLQAGIVNESHDASELFVDSIQQQFKLNQNLQQSNDDLSANNNSQHLINSSQFNKMPMFRQKNQGLQQKIFNDPLGNEQQIQNEGSRNQFKIMEEEKEWDNNDQQDDRGNRRFKYISRMLAQEEDRDLDKPSEVLLNQKSAKNDDEDSNQQVKLRDYRKLLRSYNSKERKQKHLADNYDGPAGDFRAYDQKQQNEQPIIKQENQLQFLSSPKLNNSSKKQIKGNRKVVKMFNRNLVDPSDSQPINLQNELLRQNNNQMQDSQQPNYHMNYQVHHLNKDHQGPLDLNGNLPINQLIQNEQDHELQNEAERIQIQDIDQEIQPQRLEGGNLHQNNNKNIQQDLEGSNPIKNQICHGQDIQVDQEGQMRLVGMNCRNQNNQQQDQIYSHQQHPRHHNHSQLQELCHVQKSDNQLAPPSSLIGNQNFDSVSPDSIPQSGISFSNKPDRQHPSNQPMSPSWSQPGPIVGQYPRRHVSPAWHHSDSKPEMQPQSQSRCPADGMPQKQQIHQNSQIQFGSPKNINARRGPVHGNSNRDKKQQKSYIQNMNQQ